MFSSINQCAFTLLILVNTVLPLLMSIRLAQFQELHGNPNVFNSVKANGSNTFTVQLGSDVNEDVGWEGIEIRLAKLLSQKYNFSTDFREAGHAETLGSAIAVTQELRTRKADIGIGGIYMVSDIISSVDMSISHSQDCAAFVSLASTALPRWRAIMGPFQWTVWLTLTITYLIAIFPLAFSDRHSLLYLLESPEEVENMFWYVFGTFTNCFSFLGRKSWSKSDKMATRVLIGFYWVFTIIITACYTGSIIAFVTLPLFPDTVDTVKQLLKGHYQIGTLDKGGWQNWFGNSSDPSTIKLLKDLEYVPTIEAGIRNTTGAFFWSYAFLGSRSELDYVLRTNFSNNHKKSLLHISSECFVPFGVAMTFQRNAVYKYVINQGIMRIVESGFISKFKSDVEWEMMRSATGKLLQANIGGTMRKLVSEDRALALVDTQGMFLLLSFGFLLGGIALISEVFGGCLNLCKRKRRNSSVSTVSSHPRMHDVPTPREKIRSIQYSRNSVFNIDTELIEESKAGSSNAVSTFGTENFDCESYHSLLDAEVDTYIDNVFTITEALGEEVDLAVKHEKLKDED